LCKNCNTRVDIPWLSPEQQTTPCAINVTRFSFLGYMCAENVTKQLENVFLRRDLPV